jgi:hypothetical protein
MIHRDYKAFWDPIWNNKFFIKLVFLAMDNSIPAQMFTETCYCNHVPIIIIKQFRMLLKVYPIISYCVDFEEFLGDVPLANNWRH